MGSSRKRRCGRALGVVSYFKGQFSASNVRDLVGSCAKLPNGVSHCLSRLSGPSQPYPRAQAAQARTSSSGAMKTSCGIVCWLFWEVLGTGNVLRRPTTAIVWKGIRMYSDASAIPTHPPLHINQCARRPAAASCLVRLGFSQGDCMRGGCVAGLLRAPRAVLTASVRYRVQIWPSIL